VNLDLPANPFKQALAAGRTQIGLWCTLSHHYALEAVSSAGFDWLLLDCEHSPNDLESLLPQLQAVAAYPSHPVVRVPWNDPVNIKRVLDIGAQSLLIPMVDTPEQARAAVAATRYPPAGIRGVAGTTRATRFGRVRDYAKRAHEALCVLVQVETVQALENLDAIAAVEGVDGVFIGPSDLHASFGHVGQSHHPDVWPRIEDAVVRIRRAGKAPGFLTPNEADARRVLELGGQFVAVGSDLGLLARGADALAEKFKG
jgi:4-hydroxy-2-oxoheptanedioate aldolase